MKINRRNLLLGIPAAMAAGAMGKTKRWVWRPYKMGVSMSTEKFSKIVGETLLKHQKDLYDSVNTDNALFKRLMSRKS
jgi:hypothetical protein